MPASAVIFAALGPNPAPLTELIWALAQGADYDRLEAHVVVEQRSLHYLEGEVLAPGAALAQLREALPNVDLPDLVVYEARDAQGDLITDDAEPEARAAYLQAVWQGAQAAVAAGGEHPVVFGLLAGRRRTMTALQSAVFQLLARPQDTLLDVRVSDRRVEGGTGFFFPAQPDRLVLPRHGGGVVDASTVEVQLVELPLPRLRPFVPDPAALTFEQARAACERALRDAAPPRLMIDLPSGEARADGTKLSLSPSKFVWFAYLCACMKAGEDWVSPHDLSSLQAFLQTLTEYAWWSKLNAKSIYNRILQVPDDEDDDLDPWRSKVIKALADFAETGRPGLRQLVPDKRPIKVDDDARARDHHRLPLRPEFIEILS